MTSLNAMGDAHIERRKTLDKPQALMRSGHADEGKCREAVQAPGAQRSLSLCLLTAFCITVLTCGVFVLLHGIERWLGWPALDWVSVAATGAVVGLAASAVAILTQTRSDT